MSTLRKITVQVPENDLASAQAYTGEGGDRDRARWPSTTGGHEGAQRELLKLRGKVKFSMTSNELKHDRR